MIDATAAKEPATLLIIDDNQPSREAIGQLLTAQGFILYFARTGKEALSLLEKVNPDLLLCDIDLPDDAPRIDGYDLLARIRADSRWQHLAVLFATNHATAEHMRRARQLGIEDYLVKPIDLDDLVVALKNAVRRQRQIDRIAQARVERLHRQIVGMVQHEFRTPLTFVMGYAEYLRSILETGLDLREMAASVDAILEGGRRLHHLVESFILLTDLAERPQTDLHYVSLDAGALWREVAHEFSLLLQETGLQVKFRRRAGHVSVSGDEELVRHALTRLFENAIYYRRADSPVIWLSVERKQGYVGWQIQDNGIGIEDSQLSKLGQPFFRLEEARELRHGSGLGLAVVRQIASLHSGTLEVQSEYGKGSRFTLWLPSS